MKIERKWGGNHSRLVVINDLVMRMFASWRHGPLDIGLVVEKLLVDVGIVETYFLSTYMFSIHTPHPDFLVNPHKYSLENY